MVIKGRVTTAAGSGTRRSTLIGPLMAALAAAAALSACGSAQQNPNEPHGYFPVRVVSSFPASQRLAQRSDFVVSVTNTGHRTIPDVAVTILNPRYGAAAQAFGYLLPTPAAGQPLLASRSRPEWIVMRNPGACGYSCRNLGPGGAATAYTNTWALGKLRPGHTAKFVWRVEAVRAGRFKVRYQVAAGLNGYAQAQLAGHPGHHRAQGTYTVKVTQAPAALYVTKTGKVISRP